MKIGSWLLNEQVNVLSSANNINLKWEEQLGKSLMKIKKSKGPNTLPWGTPHVTGTISDFTELTDTYCFLFLR